MRAQSKWYGYLQCIPAYEPLPMYWDPAELAPLQGTELTYILDNDKVPACVVSCRAMCRVVSC